MKINENLSQNSNQNHATLRIAFTTREAAIYLGLAVSTLNKWRCYGTGPKYLKLGRAVRYRPDDLNAFIEAHRKSTTAEYGGI